MATPAVATTAALSQRRWYASATVQASSEAGNFDTIARTVVEEE
jgi:hypothetical protein